MVDRCGRLDVGLDVGVGSERETVRVRWRTGPRAWAAAETEVVRDAVLRDATEDEVLHGVGAEA